MMSKIKELFMLEKTIRTKIKFKTRFISKLIVTIIVIVIKWMIKFKLIFNNFTYAIYNSINNIFKNERKKYFLKIYYI